MSGKPTELGYKKDTGRCKFCQAVILWGYMFGKKHPYDVRFDDDGTPHKTGSHMDTCPNWKSQGAKARADAHTEAIQNWRLSCETPNWKSQGAKARADAHTEAIQNWRNRTIP